MSVTVRPEPGPPAYHDDLHAFMAGQSFSIRRPPHPRTHHPRHAEITADRAGSVWRDDRRIGLLWPGIGDPGEPLASAPGMTVWHATRFDDQSAAWFVTVIEGMRWVARRHPRGEAPTPLTGAQAFALARWNWLDAEVGELEQCVAAPDEVLPSLESCLRADLRQAREKGDGLSAAALEARLRRPDEIAEQEARTAARDQADRAALVARLAMLRGRVEPARSAAIAAGVPAGLLTASGRVVALR